MLLRQDLRICEGKASPAVLAPAESAPSPPVPNAQLWLGVARRTGYYVPDTIYEVWKLDIPGANSFAIRRRGDAAYWVESLHSEAELVRCIEKLYVEHREEVEKPAPMTTHLKPRDLVVTPRRVVSYTSPTEAQPPLPAQYAKWWGWVRIAAMSGGTDLYAVWMHSLKRNLYFVSDAKGHTTRMHVAPSLDVLLDCVENLHRDLTMDITYTLTEAEVEQACRNYIIDRTNVKPDSITSVIISTKATDCFGEPNTTTARIFVKHHTPEVK